MNLDLPHLTLFLRRYRRRWWRGWLAALLIWGTLALARHEFGALLPWLNSQSISEQLIILCGNFVVYLILAQSMAPLAHEPHSFGLSTLRRAEGVDRAPLWLATPLAGWRAVLGCLLAGLITCLPFVLGLVAYILAAVDSEQLISQPIFWANLWISNIRLPHLALASACLLLAMRHSILAPYLPVLIAFTATLSSQWSPPFNLNYTSIFDPAAQSQSELGMPVGAQILLQGLLLLILLLGTLWWSSGRSEGVGRHGSGASSGLITGTAFLLLVGLPLLIGVSGFGSAFTSFGYELQELLQSSWLTPLHAAMLHLYPDIYSIQVNPFGDFRSIGEAGPSYSLYGSLISISAARNLLLQLLTLSLCFWAVCAVLCLEAARRPWAALSQPFRPQSPEDFLGD